MKLILLIIEDLIHFRRFDAKKNICILDKDYYYYFYIKLKGVKIDPISKKSSIFKLYLYLRICGSQHWGTCGTRYSFVRLEQRMYKLKI